MLSTDHASCIDSLEIVLSHSQLRAASAFESLALLKIWRLVHTDLGEDEYLRQRLLYQFQTTVDSFTHVRQFCGNDSNTVLVLFFFNNPPPPKTSPLPLPDPLPI